jgi:hypothetical protein
VVTIPGAAGKCPTIYFVLCKREKQRKIRKDGVCRMLYKVPKKRENAPHLTAKRQWWKIQSTFQGLSKASLERQPNHRKGIQ